MDIWRERTASQNWQVGDLIDKPRVLGLTTMSQRMPEPLLARIIGPMCYLATGQIQTNRGPQVLVQGSILGTNV